MTPASQVSLLSSHQRYIRAEKLCAWFPGEAWLGKVADQRHQQMFEAALLCGFKPGREHSHLTCLTWTERRIAEIEASRPNHIADQRRAA